MPDISVASTTPENRRIFPDAGSVTMIVLIARTVSVVTGGAWSLQAVNAETSTTSINPKRCVEHDIGIITALLYY
jgi:hypothetical protein